MKRDATDPIDRLRSERVVLALTRFEQLDRGEAAEVLEITHEGGARRFVRALKRLTDV
jgi:hypothetical protein